jgi:hypothetical protein
MPIVLISVDSVNNNLVDFKEGDIHVDLLLQSSHPDSIAIVDELMKTMNFTTNLIVPQLDTRRSDETDIDVEIRLKAVVNMVRGSGVQTAMLVSHHSVFNNWQETAIGDEWQVINM